MLHGRGAQVGLGSCWRSALRAVEQLNTTAGWQAWALHAFRCPPSGQVLVSFAFISTVVGL